MAAPAQPRRRWRWLGRLLIVAAGSYAAVVALMLLFEDRLVYHPTSATTYWVRPPASEVRDVVITTAQDEEIHGWWLPSTGSPGALLYLHGNAGNLSMRGLIVEELRDTLGLSVLIIDYPGFGKSPGAPSEQGCYRAADAAYDWLVQDRRMAPGEIVLFGKSLGGGVATELACRREHRALVLVKTFTSLPDVASSIFPWIPARLLMRNRFNTLSRIADCHRPVFVAHGTTDRLIPFALGQQLYANANAPKEFLAMPGHDHNDEFPPEFYAGLREFLTKHPAQSEPRP